MLLKSRVQSLTVTNDSQTQLSERDQRQMYYQEFRITNSHSLPLLLLLL